MKVYSNYQLIIFLSSSDFFDALAFREFMSIPLTKNFIGSFQSVYCLTYYMNYFGNSNLIYNMILLRYFFNMSLSAGLLKHFPQYKTRSTWLTYLPTHPFIRYQIDKLVLKNVTATVLISSLFLDVLSFGHICPTCCPSWRTISACRSRSTKSWLRLAYNHVSHSDFHFSRASRLLSGASWFIAPPSTLEVASVANISGFTTVGGIWRNTPPTAPVTPFFSCSSVATRTILLAVCVKP